MGPAEIGQAHFAGARLGFSVWGARCWMAGWRKHPAGLMTSYISRIIEKGTVYLVTILGDLLDRVLGEDSEEMKAVSSVVLWSDVGPHYRSNRFLGQCAVVWPQRHRVNFSICYCLEQHGKGLIDSFFGKFNQTLRRESEVSEINSLDAVVHAQRKRYELGLTLQQDGIMHEEYIEYTPTVLRHQTQTVLIARKSLLAPLKGCHAWTCTIADKRRKSFIGKDRWVTGVEVRAVLLPGMRSSADRTGFLQIAPDEDEEKEKEEPADEDEALEAMHGDTCEYMGWRCSYRKSEPENLILAEAGVRHRLRVKAAAMKGVSALLPAAPRRNVPPPPHTAARREAKASLTRWAKLARASGS